MVPDGPATAEGELSQTPFAHLLVYALDKRITGEVFLTEVLEGAKEGLTHVVRFENGIPCKMRVGDEYARLGELLLERELVQQSTLDGALATPGMLLGDMLVLGGCVEAKDVDDLLHVQLERRMVRCFSLPHTTRFKYFEKSDSLKAWGGDNLSPNPFRLLWLGIEAHGMNSAAMGSSLEQLAGMNLSLHPRAPYHRFGFDGPAMDVVDVLAMEPVAFDELLSLETTTPALVEKVVYALLLMRQIDLGKGGLPVGVEERPATVAKVQLRSSMQRRGVAIDAPGDGERTPVRPISIRRGTSGSFEVLPREEDLQAVSSGERNRVEIVTPRSGDEKPPPASAAPEGVRADSLKVPEPAAKPDEEEPSSQQRFIAEALRGMPLKDLITLAIERIDEKDPKGALDVCKVAREVDPASVDVRALAIWASSLKPGADLKVFTVQLDETIQDEDTSHARYVRGLLRKRLGEDKGALVDFKRAAELDPTNERAERDATLLARKTAVPRPEGGGLLKRLFGR